MLVTVVWPKDGFDAIKNNGAFCKIPSLPITVTVTDFQCGCVCSSQLMDSAYVNVGPCLWVSFKGTCLSWPVDFGFRLPMCTTYFDQKTL